MIDRISIVSRLAQTLYADGVPADRVKYIPHHMALFDVIAQSYATGTAPSIPLSLMAGDPCPFEATGESEFDLPIPFMVVEPSPTPKPETSPGGAAAVVEPVEVAATTVAPRKKMGRVGAVDWDRETRLGKMSDAELSRELGVSANAVRLARVTRGICLSPSLRNNRFGPKHINWDAEPRLGKVPDAVIATDLGVVPSAVRAARDARRIPAAVKSQSDGTRSPSAQAGIRWNEETRLGKIPDSELARALGVTPGAVHQARQARGIPSATPKPKPPETTVTPERQAEIEKIEAAVTAGKVRRITPEEAKADLEAKYRAEQAQYGWKSRAQKKGKAVAS